MTAKDARRCNEDGNERNSGGASLKRMEELENICPQIKPQEDVES